MSGRNSRIRRKKWRDAVFAFLGTRSVVRIFHVRHKRDLEKCQASRDLHDLYERKVVKHNAP